MTIVVLLTLRDGALDAFRAFETQAAAIMAKHGGAIERAIVIRPRGAGESWKEVHVVTFPDEGAFAAYRCDDALKALASMRNAAVSHTEIMIGEEGPDYASKTISTVE